MTETWFQLPLEILSRVFFQMKVTLYTVIPPPKDGRRKVRFRKYARLRDVPDSIYDCLPTSCVTNMRFLTMIQECKKKTKSLSKNSPVDCGETPLSV